MNLDECVSLSKQLIEKVGQEDFFRELQDRTMELVDDLKENSTNWTWEPNTQEPEKDVVYRLMDHIMFQMIREIQLTDTLPGNTLEKSSKGFKN